MLVALTSASAEMLPKQREFFESKIRPVLVQQCYECHSVDAKKIGGKLRLDSPADMLTGGESGSAMTPGDPDESLIIQALRYEGIEMPPKKPLPASVVEDFVTWVKMGAPDPRENLPTRPASEITTDKAALWAYQPVREVEVPTVKDQEWPKDPVDAFILSKIEDAQLSPSRDASPSVLIRRLSFDLIGLPPTFQEVADFQVAVQKDRRGAVRDLVDRLLASPHFGERWGRHWLDVARYAESNGNDGLSRNPSFPHAWRYRDYVIQAFNDDTPYDQFLTEQIAGDLLPADSPGQRDRHLIATGFLAIGAKPAKAMNDNFAMDVVADQIGVVGSGIMGLSVGCARCHDHKTDPIPTVDYYALAGIFKSTETLWGAAAHQKLTAPQTPLHELKAASVVSPHPETQKVLLSHTPRKEPEKPAFEHPLGSALAMGVRDAQSPADCKLNINGESKKLGAAVTRGFVRSFEGFNHSIKINGKQSGRLELAQWLTHPKHPQTARVMVNRIWQHLFGRGLVRTPDDFGVFGERPSHPELLDHLAKRFVENGWSVKQLIRSLALTRTYQLSSDSDANVQRADPENRLQTHHSRRRLDAESLRDAMLSASGQLNSVPALGSVIQETDVLINEMGDLHQPSQHRSIYLLMLRNSMPPELTPFNLPEAITVTGQRDVTTLPTQALYLLNNDFIVEQANRLAARTSIHADMDARARATYRHALAREPNDAETRRTRDFVSEVELMLASSEHDAVTGMTDAWAVFCQALLSSNAFRYVD